MPFIKLDEINQPLRVLVYGDSGIGKTTFAARAYRHSALREVAIADYELGLKTVTEVAGNVLYSAPTNVRDIANDVLPIASGQLEGVRTVIIDSLTKLAADESRSTALEAGHADFVAPLDYGVTRTRIGRLMQMLNKANVHQIYTALETDETMTVDGQTVPQKRRPALTPALAKEVSQSMDMVFYLFRDPDGYIRLMYREMVYPNNFKVVAKLRSDKLPALLDEVAKEQGLTNTKYPSTLVIGSTRNPDFVPLGFDYIYELYNSTLS